MDCNQQESHSFYVAEVIGVESEGKVFVLRVCTHCPAAHMDEFVVAKPHEKIRLLREERQQ